MKIELNDPLLSQFLRIPLLIFLLVLASFGAINYFLGELNAEIRTASQSKTHQLDGILQQVLFLQRQEQIYQQFGEKYQQFLKEGLVNQQDRVKWTDELLKIKKNLLMSPFLIQFEPEQKLEKSNVKNLVIEKDIFYYTNLNIDAGLHTDLDILSLFDQISENITSLYLVKKCQLKANREKLTRAEFNPERAIIDAKCTIVLFQARPREFTLGVNQ